MRVKMLVDTRIRLTRGAEYEVEEKEAARLLSLGFAVKSDKAEKVEKAVKIDDAEAAESVNTALDKTMKLISIENQGIEKAVKAKRKPIKKAKK